MMAAMPARMREEIESAEHEVHQQCEREERREQALVKRIGLSPVEARIFLRLKCKDGISREELIEWVYEVVWEDLGRLSRRRHRAKLRTRLHSLNRKLDRAGLKRIPLEVDRYATRVSARAASVHEMRRALGRPDIRPAAIWRRNLAACEAVIRRALSCGPLPSWKLRKLCRDKGCPPGTVKKARKRLGVIPTRAGFGGNGEWWLSLPAN
jgi:hypothetical protein